MSCILLVVLAERCVHYVILRLEPKNKTGLDAIELVDMERFSRGDGKDPASGMSGVKDVKHACMGECAVRTPTGIVPFEHLPIYSVDGAGR